MVLREQKKPQPADGFVLTKEEYTNLTDGIGLSIKEIAERLDINRATVHAYRMGQLKVTTMAALATTKLAEEVGKEREETRRRLKRYGYSEDEQANLLSVLPSGLAMALITPKGERFTMTTAKSEKTVLVPKEFVDEVYFYGKPTKAEEDRKAEAERIWKALRSAI